jgi:hypothetical protein
MQLYCGTATAATAQELALLCASTVRSTAVSDYAACMLSAEQ